MVIHTNCTFVDVNTAFCLLMSQIVVCCSYGILSVALCAC